MGFYPVNPFDLPARLRLILEQPRFIIDNHVCKPFVDILSISSSEKSKSYW